MNFTRYSAFQARHVLTIGSSLAVAASIALVPAAAWAQQVGTGTVGAAGGTAISGGASATTSATGSNAIAIGNQANGNGTSALAVGTGATANGLNATATGPQALANGNAATATGANASATGLFATATGNISVANGAQATATGASSNANGALATATGANAQAVGQRASAYGFGANATGATATAIGNATVATGLLTTSLGSGANAAAAGGTALGGNAIATNPNDVALGAGSITTAPHVGNFTLNGLGGPVAGTSPGSIVSIGTAGNERQIQNLAAGVVSPTSTDAINGSQLYVVASVANTIGTTVATDLGGGSTYNPATGAVSAPTYVIGGVTYNSVGAALAAAAASGGGGGNPYFVANSTGTPASATGTNAVAAGQGTNASGAQSVAIGVGAAATASGSVAIGAGSVANAPNTVSFGTPGNERRLTNVAPGVAPTDGVNVSQLQGGLSNLQSQINANARNANAGIANAMAAAGLRYDDRPGKLSSAIGVATYGNQAGLALGVGWTSESQLWRLNGGAAMSPSNTGHTDVGLHLGLTYTWN